MPRRPQNKTELMKAIEHEWKLLMKVVEALTDEQMTTPDAGGWSPKDNLAHLAEWMNILMGYHLDKRPAHKVMGVSEEVTRDWRGAGGYGKEASNNLSSGPRRPGVVGGVVSHPTATTEPCMRLSHSH